jgi:hypothetical protein
MLDDLKRPIAWPRRSDAARRQSDAARHIPSLLAALFARYQNERKSYAHNTRLLFGQYQVLAGRETLLGDGWRNRNPDRGDGIRWTARKRMSRDGMKY